GPADEWQSMPLRRRPVVPVEMLANCLPSAIRSHVLESHFVPEHRPVTVAFIRFAGTDALIENSGAAAAADALHGVVSAIEAIADEQMCGTAEVLGCSKPYFETSRLEPFAVKRKAEPVQAWSLGRGQSATGRQVSVHKLPLTGRNVELGIVRKAFVSARSGAGRLIEVSGEAGIGKTRLLEALRDAAAGFRKSHAACEAYTASTPYALWQELL